MSRTLLFIQGQPTGEGFIQMKNEQAAYQAAQQRHYRNMTFGKKQRYIEVFQCSAGDMNTMLTPSTVPEASYGTTTAVTAAGVATSQAAAAAGKVSSTTPPSNAPGILSSGMLPLTNPPPPPPAAAGAAGTNTAAQAVTPQVSSASSSLTGLDPLAASAAQYAASNPLLMNPQNLASVGQGNSQLTAAQQYQQQVLAAQQAAVSADPNSALRAAYGTVPTTQATAAAAANAASMQQLYAQQGLYAANPALGGYGAAGLLQVPGAHQAAAGGGLLMHPGLARLPTAGVAGAGLAGVNPALAGYYQAAGAQTAAAGALLQNPVYAAQQRLLLQQQQNAAAIMAAQQQQQLQRQQQQPGLAAAQAALLAAQQSAAAITGKRSFDQAFVGGQAGVAGGKRSAYSSTATISANPTSYISSQANGTS